MSFFLKLLTALVVFVAVYFFSFWMLFAQIVPETMLSLADGAAVLTAAVLGWLTWQGMSNLAPGLLSCMATGAGILGAIGFCGGFFGPMIFMPEANQGPLIGLFITGPLGFVLGAVCGFVYGLWIRSRRYSV
jgi:hypothetical protein